MASVDNPDTHTPWGAPSPTATIPPPPPPPPSAGPPPPTGRPIRSVYIVPPPRDVDDSLQRKGRYLFAASLIAAMVVGAVFIVRSVRPAEWDPVLEPYVAFVESERGLSFDHPVEVRWANIADDLASSFEVDQRVAPERDPFEEAYRLLGLIDPEPDVGLTDGREQTAVENAGAFYEPWSETIVLPEGQDLDALGYTIVHELTHALQDQNGLMFPRPDSADSRVARTALIEGDAERIAVAWFAQLTEAERQAYLDAVGADEQNTFEDPGDAFLEASFYASYAVGLPMTQAIVATEGVDGLDRLMRAKDVGTTERMLDVLATSPTSAIDADERLELPDGWVTPDGDIGALTWFQTLAPLIGTEAALDALIGYDNDAFAVFDRSGLTCARFQLFFDASEEAEEFAALVAPHLEMETALAANGTLSARADVCSPVGDPSDQRYATILPLSVLNEMLVVHLSNGVSPEVARCAALEQAATISVDASANEFPGWDAIDAAAPAFLEGCR